MKYSIWTLFSDQSIKVNETQLISNKFISSLFITTSKITNIVSILLSNSSEDNFIIGIYQSKTIDFSLTRYFFPKGYKMRLLLIEFQFDLFLKSIIKQNFFSFKIKDLSIESRSIVEDQISIDSLFFRIIFN